MKGIIMLTKEHVKLALSDSIQDLARQGDDAILKGDKVHAQVLADMELRDKAALQLLNSRSKLQVLDSLQVRFTEIAPMLLWTGLRGKVSFVKKGSLRVYAFATQWNPCCVWVFDKNHAPTQ